MILFYNSQNKQTCLPSQPVTMVNQCYSYYSQPKYLIVSKKAVEQVHTLLFLYSEIPYVAQKVHEKLVKITNI